jgi:hypothetical protein
MKAYERLAGSARERSDGWRVSAPASGLGAAAWALAVAVVAVIALGLYLLHG